MKERLPATIISTPLELDDYVAAYEAARAGNDKADPAAFLPPPEHALYSEVLRELIRVDLEYAWRSGQGTRLGEEYHRLRRIALQHPELTPAVWKLLGALPDAG